MPSTAEMTEIAGRDHPVAEEQAGSEDPERHQHRAVRDPPAADQRGQRHDPAVATVVGAHDEAGVLDRDDDHQRPEDQRHDAVDARRGRVHGVVVGVEDDLHGVQRAGSDVAVDDPQRAEGEDRPAGVGDDVAVLVARRPQRFGGFVFDRSGRTPGRPASSRACGRPR